MIIKLDKKTPRTSPLLRMLHCLLNDQFKGFLCGLPIQSQTKLYLEAAGLKKKFFLNLVITQ